MSEQVDRAGRPMFDKDGKPLSILERRHAQQMAVLVERIEELEKSIDALLQADIDAIQGLNVDIFNEAMKALAQCRRGG